MSGRILRAAALAAALVPSAIAQSFINPAPNTEAFYTPGQAIEIQWTSPWEESTLNVYQSPLYQSGPQPYQQNIVSNAPSSQTSFTWHVEPIVTSGYNQSQVYFYFELRNAADQTQLVDSGAVLVRDDAAASSVAAPTATATSSSDSSSSTAAAATTTAASSTTAAAAETSTAATAASTSAAAAATTAASTTSSAASASSTADAQPDYLSSYLGVSLGVGIPVLLAAIAGTVFAIRNKRRANRQSVALEKGRGAV